MGERETTTCDECGSAFFTITSKMEGLCPECAHWLYGYPRCEHVMHSGRCEQCGWDGSASAYVRGLQAG